jgi:hypothetical protein
VHGHGERHRNKILPCHQAHVSTINTAS